MESKIKVDRKVEKYIDFEMKLVDFIKLCEDWVKEYGDECFFDREMDYGGDYETHLMVSREETDAEYAERLEREAREAEWDEERARATYDELRKRFEEV